MAPRRLLPLHDLDRRRRVILHRSPLLLPKINQNLLAGVTHRRQHLLLLRTRGFSRLRCCLSLFHASRQGKRRTLLHNINKKCIDSILPYFHHLRILLLLPVAQRWRYFYFDLDDLSRRYINLLPFWFLTSTIAYLLGAWLERLAKLRLSLVGALMNFMIWLLIAGEIYHNGFIKKALNL